LAPRRLDHQGLASARPLEVDLHGQAHSELGPEGLMSGPGAASDFARGPWAAGGARIVAFAASGPVSLGRTDTDIVVTEYGAADLRGLDHHERAGSLIALAPSDHRERLGESWSPLAAKF
jgi:acyl-CoA hydrolase